MFRPIQTTLEGQGAQMKIIKRNKQEVEFDISKIINAITKANDAETDAKRITV